MFEEILLKAVTFARDKFDSIEIFTNGTLLNENNVLFLKENNVNIAISLYSYIPNEHDKVTQTTGSFELTTKAITLLKKHSIKYRVARVILKEIELGEKNTDLFELSKTRDYVRICGKADLSLYSKELLKGKLITKETFERKLHKNSVLHNLNRNYCFSKNIYISSNLDVFPCVMERRISYGSLKNNNLVNIVNNRLMNINKDKIEVCKDCEFRYACRDCRPDSLSENVFSKPWYCTYNPYKGVWEEKEKFIDELIRN